MRERILLLIGRLDSPKLVLALTAFGYLAFIVLRLKVHHFEPSAFILAGDRYTNPQMAGVAPLRSSDGYDGQYYYRLALDPFTTEQTAHGVTLDSPAYRQQRILYPLLVWALSLRLPAVVPWMMIVVNYVCLCVIGWLAARAAVAENRHALWGACLALYPGFLLSVARDLVEPTAMMFLVGSLLALRRGRPTCGAVLLVLAVLTRETTLLVAGAAVAIRLVSNGSGAKEAPNWSFGLLPLLVAAVWQTLLWRVWGEWPVLSGGHNLGLPFEGVNSLVRSVMSSADVQQALAPGLAQALAAAELGFVAAGTLLIGLSAWRGAAPAVEKLAWVLFVILAACLTSRVWLEDWAFLRVLSEWYVIGWLMLLRGPRWAGLPVEVTALGLWLFLFRTRLA